MPFIGGLVLPFAIDGVPFLEGVGGRRRERCHSREEGATSLILVAQERRSTTSRDYTSTILRTWEEAVGCSGKVFWVCGVARVFFAPRTMVRGVRRGVEGGRGLRIPPQTRPGAPVYGLRGPANAPLAGGRGAFCALNGSPDSARTGCGPQRRVGECTLCTGQGP